MKKMIVPVVLSALAFSTPSYASHPMCGKTELADLMGDMKGSMKAVKKAVKSGDIEKVSMIANELMTAVNQSTDLVPLAISDQKTLTAKQQADFKKYQKGMEYLKSAVSELAQAKDLPAIKSALGKIGKASKKGHKAFKMDCDD
ncbi:cytochrome b562 [Thalassotalea euphylliae]|uniref:Cytochrome b562 n=1 Tax=Thalassotalea euphylliae TaxID=1655234 RepID=A0A3E0U379_9GAMM|nr:cytochrome b562 [Thalassotalea euphylliae]REL30462.1 hypothetical protein DXX94_06925 [Thalassotalea euphylliae]